MQLFHRNNPAMVSIVMRRDSVSMGDDCLAPHEKHTSFACTDTLHDLLEQTADYVPAMRNYEWEVLCDRALIGRLISDASAKYQIITDHPQMKIAALPKREIFCRKYIRNNPLSYYEHIEVLFAGEYFTLTAFRDYGNIQTILEQGATKITTCDKVFAVKHGFTHRALQWYDRILKLEEFEGLRITRVPNDLHVKTETLEISKDDVMKELQRRARIDEPGRNS